MDRYHILLGMPGPHIRFATAQSAFLCVGKGHDLKVVGKDNASWDNMNALWITALNAVKHDGITHYAMLHADICPDLNQDWLNIMLTEMESKGASYISVPIPIKDQRGLTSCGIADPDDPWAPIRRFTMNEIYALPETFDEKDIGYEGYPLNHNSGLIIADLRNPAFFKTKPDGELACWFEFRKRCYMEDGVACIAGESEDWNMSRRLWECGIQTCITRKVRVRHYGSVGLPNTHPWGVLKTDKDCALKWKQHDHLITTATDKELPPGSCGSGDASAVASLDAPALPFVFE